MTESIQPRRCQRCRNNDESEERRRNRVLNVQRRKSCLTGESSRSGSRAPRQPRKHKSRLLPTWTQTAVSRPERRRRESNLQTTRTVKGLKEGEQRWRWRLPFLISLPSRTQGAETQQRTEWGAVGDGRVVLIN